MKSFLRGALNGIILLILAHIFEVNVYILLLANIIGAGFGYLERHLKESE